MSTDIELHPAIKKLREEMAEIEMQVLTNFTLADALREGSGVTDQLYGDFLTNEGSCALGAAYLSAKARGYI